MLPKNGINLVSRRGFIAQGTAVTLGLAATGAVPGRTVRPAERMTLGFSTYGMKTLATERAVAVLGEIGYDTLEINLWPGWDADPQKLSAARRKAIRGALRDAGVRVAGFMGALKPTAKDADQQKALDQIRRAAELGHELELDGERTPLIQSTLAGKKWADMKDVFLRRLEEWTRVAERERIVVAIKPHRGGALSRPAEAAWLIEQLGKPKWLRMCYDYSHYDFRDMTLDGTIRDALPYTAHIAIKEAVMHDGRIRFVNPGRGGRIDFARLIRRFHEGGYRGDVCCEVSGQVWNVKGYDPVASARQCYESVAPAFVKAGVPRP